MPGKKRSVSPVKAKNTRARKEDPAEDVVADDDDDAILAKYIAIAANERGNQPAPTEEEISATKYLIHLRQKRVAERNGTPAANNGLIIVDHEVTDAVWQVSKVSFPERLKSFLAVEGGMIQKLHLSDCQVLVKHLKSIFSPNRHGANGCSAIGITRMYHTEEHRAQMDEFLNEVKRHDHRFADLSILAFERALLWGALRYRAWDDAVTDAVVDRAACYYGLLLAINVKAGGYATPELEQRYAWFYRQSELRRMRYAGDLFDQRGQLRAKFGTQLEIEVAHAGKAGGSGRFVFRTRNELIIIIAKLRVQAPDVSAKDLADGGVAYATEFVATWGDADGHRLMPAALGYTVWLVRADGTRGDRLYGRESWGPVQAAGIGVTVRGELPKGERDPTFGYLTPRHPPRSAQERKEQAREWHADLEAARVTLAQVARDLGPSAVTAVDAVVALCGQRPKMLEFEYEPLIAAALATARESGFSHDDAPLRDFVQKHEVVMMHEARPQVAGGMNAQIDVRIAELRATWTGSPEKLELAVEAMREKAAADARTRGENVQIDVRIAELRATWTGSPEKLELAVEAMREKAAADAKKAAASGGAAPRSTLKATGCMITVTEVNKIGELLSKPHVLKASREESQARFCIDASAKGGVFDEPRFRLMIHDSHSGATADALGNILDLSSFVVERRDGRRFLCKFTALIAAAAVSGDKALDVVT